MAVTLALLLTSCGDGLVPDRVPMDEADLAGLKVKLKALSTDPCATEPRNQRPDGCEKYTTQLRNAANAAEAVSRAGRPELAAPARKMSDGIRAYRTGECQTPDPASVERCGDALVTIADGLAEVEAKLTTG